MSAPTDHHALLIGIDCYMPNRLPNGDSYPSLRGCVRDVELIAGFLGKALEIPEERIFRLTAGGTGEEPVERPERWPTRDNIVAAFEKVTKDANAGDHVYIHYSGHGGRTRTMWPKLKGQKGIDEALVPTDIGSDAGRYLRDLEVAALIRKMVDKGLVVAVTLDCCHSGGITRAGAATARGIRSEDTRVPQEASCIVSAEEVASMLAEGATRNVASAVGLLPEPKGYTVLAACLKTESAYEATFNGFPCGALSYWMRELLQLGSGLTYKTLCERLVARVHSQFPAQTPMVMGEVNRVVFGVEERRLPYTAKVLEQDSMRGARLDVGMAHGVGAGARFVVHPLGTETLEGQEGVAELEVREAAAVASWADVTTTRDGGEIEPGAPAVLVGPTKARFVRKVELIEFDEHSLREGLEEEIRRAGWVQLRAPEETADFLVRVDEAGCFEILDSAGKAVPWMRPVIDVSHPGATKRVVGRLEHLARFRALSQLANHDARSPLAYGLEVELLGWRRKHEPSDPFEPEGKFEGPAELEPGYWTALRVRNGTPKVLNVCLFDLQPDWGVTLVWPIDGAGFRTLDPGEEEIVPLRVDLPKGYDEGVDVLKVFATVGATDFRWLELPALEQSRHRKAVGKQRPEGELEKLLAMFSKERPVHRHAWVGGGASEQWVTGQVEIRVRRTT